MENAINQFGSRSPSTVQLPQGTLDLHQGHKVMINLAQDLLTTSQLFSTIYNLIVQVWGSSLPLPSSLIMHSHNLRIILQAVCSLLWCEMAGRLQEELKRRARKKIKPPCAEQQFQQFSNRGASHLWALATQWSKATVPQALLTVCFM